MNKYGAVLDDFGLEAMLNQFMEEFIAPVSKGYLISFCVVVDGKKQYWFHCFNISVHINIMFFVSTISFLP